MVYDGGDGYQIHYFVKWMHMMIKAHKHVSVSIVTNVFCVNTMHVNLFIPKIIKTGIINESTFSFIY